VSVRVQGPDGQVVEVEPEQVSALADRGYKVLSDDARAEQVANSAREEFYSTPGQKISAGIAGAARGATFGLSDALGRAMGAREELDALREYNPGVSLATEIGGSLLTAKVPAGIAAKVVPAAADGAAVLSKFGRAAAGAAVEGAIYGAGSGVSEVALQKEPIEIEKAISTIGSSAFFGGAVGGAAGLLTKGISVGGKALASKLDDVAAKGATAPVDDVARQAFTDEVAAFRKSTVDDQLFQVVKGASDRETKTIAKVWLEADKSVDRVLRNPKALTSDPKRVLSALQQQEHAMEQIVAKADDLRMTLRADAELFAASSEGKVAQMKLEKLEKIQPALDANRALQAKIETLSAKPVASGGGGFAANMMGGQAFGMAAGIVGAIPVIGPVLAPFAGAAASKAVNDGIGKLASKQAARMSSAIKAVVNVTERAAPVAPVLASKVLANVTFGAKSAPAKTLAANYKSRTDELKQMSQYDMTGRAVMRPEPRAKIAASLAPVRQASPQLADQIETLVARKIEALANRIPRRPDVMAMHSGPDRWQPSDMEMRAFARYVSAVEDPAGVFERVAGGTVTPEDGEALREVYPEMFADFQQKVFAQMATLQKTLPYQKRLALSIFSGVPVDPSMSPRVLSVLQEAYAAEEKPTMPEAKFGSVKVHDATPSQERGGLGS
jgi:hypothetical protein